MAVNARLQAVLRLSSTYPLSVIDRPKDGWRKSACITELSSISACSLLLSMSTSTWITDEEEG